jgi:hypothetical protein
MWKPVMQLKATLMKDAQKEAKTYESGRWRWAKNPGDGRLRSSFQCNAHEECTKLIQVKLLHDGSFALQETGEHTLVVKEKRRVNSTLSFTHEAEVRKAVNQGAKPAGILLSLTLEKEAQLEDAGQGVFDNKKEGGGLEGARLLDTCVLVCITHVSHMYHGTET